MKSDVKGDMNDASVGIVDVVIAVDASVSGTVIL